MSDVEKLTFENHRRRRAIEEAIDWERRAVESANRTKKQQKSRSLLFFATYLAYMVLGILATYTVMATLAGDVAKSCGFISASLFALVACFWLSDKVERC